MSGPSLSRRGLFGAGVRRALEARLDELEPPSPPRRARDDLSEQLGGRLGPVAEVMVDLAEVAAGDKVLTLATGNDVLRTAAARSGAAVAAAEDVRLEWPDEEFDAVLAFFSTTSHPDPRLVASELKRVARSCARIVLAAWSGQPWARYETAYRHFFDFPGLDVRDHELAESGIRYSTVFCRKP